MLGRYESSVTAPKLPHFEWQEPEDEKDLKDFRDIVTAGCTVLMIYPDEAGGGPPFDFIYTVGFYLNLQHPEFFIKGILSDAAGTMMNSLFLHVEDGNHIKDGTVVHYDLGDGEIKFVAKTFPLDRYYDYMGWGCWFYRSLFWKISPIAVPKFPVLQLFWPDAQGLYPWDDGCDPRVRAIQTPVEVESESEDE